MPYSYNDFTGDGVTVVYTISFEGDYPGYIEEDHVFVEFDGVVQDQADRTFDTPTQIQLLAAPVSGTNIRFQRSTSITEALVDFEGGAQLSEGNLDKNTLQMLYLTQEAFDVGEATTTDIDLAVAAAQAAQVAAELAQSESEDARDDAVIAKNAAVVAQTGAETAETNAETAEINAANSASASSTSATEAEDAVASVNLPIVTTGDVGKILRVNSAEDGYELLHGITSQSTLVAHTVLLSEANTQIVLSALATADRVFTLPSVGSDDDGVVFHLLNNSDFKLTIQPSDIDSVWNSGAGYGIETNGVGAYCSLRYDHATTSWQPLQIGGGLWLVEGLELWISGTKLHVATVSTGSGIITDITRKHSMEARSTLALDTGGAVSLSYDSFFTYNGSSDYGTIKSSNAWDIVNDNTEDITMMFRFRTDSIGVAENFISQYEDSNNRYGLGKTAGDEFRFTYVSGGVTQINMSAGALAALTWYTGAFIRVGVNAGLYIGDSTLLNQIDFTNSWTENALIGSLYTGQKGDGTNYKAGRSNDILLSYQNLFNAAPVVGLTDNITIPTKLNLVMGDS